MKNIKTCGSTIKQFVQKHEKEFGIAGAIAGVIISTYVGYSRGMHKGNLQGIGKMTSCAMADIDEFMTLLDKTYGELKPEEAKDIINAGHEFLKIWAADLA